MPKQPKPATPPRRSSHPRAKAKPDELRKIVELRRRALLETNKTSALLTQLDPPPKDGRVHRQN